MSVKMINDAPVGAYLCEGNEDCQNLNYLYQNDEGTIVRACPLHVDLAFSKAEEKRARDYTLLDNF